MCGDPPNIIIGTSLGFSFADFVTNTGLIAVIALVLVVIYFYFIFRKELTENAGKIDPSTLPDPEEAIVSKKGFTISCVIFLCAVVLLVTHSQTGLTVSCIGVFIAWKLVTGLPMFWLINLICLVLVWTSYTLLSAAKKDKAKGIA